MAQSPRYAISLKKNTVDIVRVFRMVSLCFAKEKEYNHVATGKALLYYQVNTGCPRETEWVHRPQSSIVTVHCTPLSAFWIVSPMNI